MEMALSRQRLPGIMRVFNSLNRRVARRTRQINNGDYAMATVRTGHAAAGTPHCTTHYRSWLENGLLAEVSDNHHSLCHHAIPTGVRFSHIRLVLPASAGTLPALYGLQLHQSAAIP